MAIGPVELWNEFSGDDPELIDRLVDAIDNKLRSSEFVGGSSVKFNYHELVGVSKLNKNDVIALERRYRDVGWLKGWLKIKNKDITFKYPVYR